MGLGVPSVNIAFIEQSITAIQRGERGIIAMILTDAGMDDKSSFTAVKVCPDGLSDGTEKDHRILYEDIGGIYRRLKMGGNPEV